MRHDNIKIPTLGGRQYWSDQFIHAGWRIQKNIWMDHHRLLDPNDFRVAFGDWKTCRDCFDTHEVSQRQPWPHEHLVILVHGLCRTKGAFYKMRKMLQEKGFSVQAINYPSTQQSTDKFVEQLNNLLSSLRGIAKVSFVTHSLGGIIVRKALSEKRDWMEKLDIGDVIQIAPPNRGARIANSFKDISLFQWGAGPAGTELANGFDIDVPKTCANFHVIAGGTGTKRGFNPFLGCDNDGLVAIEETALTFPHAQHQFHAPHTLLINNPETLALVNHVIN
ncbi:hypothetical protein RYZ26_19235 [Terasakiella sp. A23]|uniref:esterase/lipase family protein n=1 Tax=Terasakiella sp. FCG-A23 TaxID=3080561 RepID=UPI00295436D1|nr:hypothetical protein [Terasakiella sp. A23]MDV7341743.1 hypothetical protein [Terasakiella sp. A23]